MHAPRRQSIASMLALLAATAACGRHAERPRVLNRQAELLLNDRAWIARADGLKLVPPEVRKHPANPLLVADRPWEKAGILNYVCVLHDVEEGLYKMWYQILGQQKPDGTPSDPGDIGSYSRCLYAVSRDGVHWKKPELGLVEFQGSTKNNIVFGDPNKRPRGTPVYWVIKDHADVDRARRYKMLLNFWDHRGRGVALATSPDGLHWAFPDYGNLLGSFDTQNVFFWDDRVGAWVGYLRSRINGKRASARATSPDGLHWSNPVTVDRPDAGDPPNWEPYGPGAFKYSRARDVYVMYVGGWDARSGLFEGNLGLSRDGIGWFRFRGPSFLAVSPGTWDGGSTMPIPSEAVVEGQTAVYYVGSRHGMHDASADRGIGLATLPEAGFAGWRADGEGSLTTRLVEASDLKPALYLNLDATGGEATAELLDARGSVFDGFARGDCEPVTTRGSLVEIRWKGQASLEPVVAQGAFRIRVHLRRATLYGFRVIFPRSAAALF